MSLALLREKTGPMHQRLDAKLRLFERVVDRHGYSDHLLRFYELLLPYEEKLHGFQEWQTFGINWAQRKKLPLLAKDLKHFKIEPPATSSNAKSLRLPHGSFAESVGTLYVLEGSTLGGQIIAAHYRNALQLEVGSGLSFHTAYGSETGKMWKSFCAALDRIFLERPDHRERIILAACETFETVEQALCDPRTPIGEPHG